MRVGRSAAYHQPQLKGHPMARDSGLNWAIGGGVIGLIGLVIGLAVALRTNSAEAPSRVRIDDALAKISERYQLAIRLRLIEELPREVCAERMQVTVSTFDVVFFRATRAFRKHYGEREQ